MHEKFSIQLQDGLTYMLDQPVYKLIKKLQRRLKRQLQVTSHFKKIMDLTSEENRFAIEYIKVNLDDAVFFVPKYASHRPAIVDLLYGELYEPKTHLFVRGFFAQISGSMVHAGVFFGDMLPSFSKSVDGKVYAFEPVPENFMMAKLCVEANQLDNVLLFNAALSDRLANLKINTRDPDEGHAGGTSEIGERGVFCPALTIDALGSTDIAMIQLDVEGHELIALNGASETIERCRPVVAVEDNNQNCTAFLLERNYEMVGEIPGLVIWVPSENQSYLELSRELIESLSA